MVLAASLYLAACTGLWILKFPAIGTIFLVSGLGLKFSQRKSRSRANRVQKHLDITAGMRPRSPHQLVHVQSCSISWKNFWLWFAYGNPNHDFTQSLPQPCAVVYWPSRLNSTPPLSAQPVLSDPCGLPEAALCSP